MEEFLLAQYRIATEGGVESGSMLMTLRRDAWGMKSVQLLLMAETAEVIGLLPKDKRRLQNVHKDEKFDAMPNTTIEVFVDPQQAGDGRDWSKLVGHGYSDVVAKIPRNSDLAIDPTME